MMIQTHTDPTDSLVIDWVVAYKPEYPHIVRIPDLFHRSDLTDWLCVHVGERGHAWQWPTANTYMFKESDHAVQFALIFS
jgi:hypothetical protein